MTTLYVRYRSKKSNENEISYAVPVTSKSRDSHTIRWNEKKILKKYDPRKLLLESHRKVNKLSSQSFRCFFLFFSVLFCSVLFCFFLFCSVLFCSVLYFYCFFLYLYLFYFVLFCSVLFCFVLFCFILKLLYSVSFLDFECKFLVWYLRSIRYLYYFKSFYFYFHLWLICE